MNKLVRYFGAVLLFLLAALLVIAAVPASVLARFRNRTARERKAAIAAFAGIPASFGQDFDPEIAAAAETLRAYGFPFVSSGFSNHFEPPTSGELAAIRAWRKRNGNWKTFSDLRRKTSASGSHADCGSSRTRTNSKSSMAGFLTPRGIGKEAVGDEPSPRQRNPFQNRSEMSSGVRPFRTPLSVAKQV